MGSNPTPSAYFGEVGRQRDMQSGRPRRPQDPGTLAVAVPLGREHRSVRKPVFQGLDFMPPLNRMSRAAIDRRRSRRLRRGGMLSIFAVVVLSIVGLIESRTPVAESTLARSGTGTSIVDPLSTMVAAQFEGQPPTGDVPDGAVSEDGRAAFFDRRVDRQPDVREPGPNEPHWEERRDDLETLMNVVGHDFKTTVTDGDIDRTARRLGVSIASPPTLEDAARLLHAHRQHASASIRALGYDHGDRVVEADLARAAERVGVEVDEPVSPAGVEAIIKSAAQYVDAKEHGVRPNPDAKTPLFASVKGIALHVPSTDVALVGFHQSLGGGAQLQHHKNTRMTTLPSRGRGTGSRTAADISVAADTPVLSPVTGEVVAVQHYALYGRYADVLIHIVPEDNPAARVDVLHVTGPRVEVGDRVRAGETVIAGRATKLPFASQIDRVAGPLPHVHIEVVGG